MAVTPLVIITQKYLIRFEFLCCIKASFYVHYLRLHLQVRCFRTQSGPKHLTVSAVTLSFGGAILLKDLGCLVCFCQIGVSLILSLHVTAIFI